MDEHRQRDKDHERQQYREMREDYPDREKTKLGIENRFDGSLPFISGGIAVSSLLGMNSAVPGDDATRQLLVTSVPVALGGLSYIANKAAFHHGAKLAASGDRVAIGLVLGWFGVMGITVGTIGFAGVSREIVEAEKLRQPAQHMATVARRATEVSADANKVVHLIGGGASDFSGIASSENTTGGVSGRRGRGVMVERLEGLESRFREVERSYARAEKGRTELIGKLESLTASYEAQLNQGGAHAGNRAKLLAIYGQAQSLATELANVVPTSAAQALVSELRSTPAPPAVSGRIDVGARLRGHADRLEEALADVKAASIVLPPFPAPSGLLVGWERLDLTAPLAIVLFALEAIVIVLWVLLVRDFMARRRSSGRGNVVVDDDDSPDAPTAGAVAVPTHQPAYTNGDARQAGGSHDPRPARQRHT